ncbi:hypothetical protein Tco_0703190 [Tanacetum coccineum]|uniref:Secreted protein n=1 Tax=Tanacetum coccineum TaxID=301880 RepID=A0ABQ4XY93_9ASTR
MLRSSLISPTLTFLMEGFAAVLAVLVNRACIKFTMLAVLITKTSPKQDKHVTLQQRCLWLTLGRISFVTANTKEYHSECSGKISRIMRRTL